MYVHIDCLRTISLAHPVKYWSRHRRHLWDVVTVRIFHRRICSSAHLPRGHFLWQSSCWIAPSKGYRYCCHHLTVAGMSLSTLIWFWYVIAKYVISNGYAMMNCFPCGVVSAAVAAPRCSSCCCPSCRWSWSTRRFCSTGRLLLGTFCNARGGRASAFRWQGFKKYDGPRRDEERGRHLREICRCPDSTQTEHYIVKVVLDTHTSDIWGHAEHKHFVQKGTIHNRDYQTGFALDRHVLNSAFLRLLNWVTNSLSSSYGEVKAGFDPHPMMQYSETPI